MEIALDGRNMKGSDGNTNRWFTATLGLVYTYTTWSFTPATWGGANQSRGEVQLSHAHFKGCISAT